MNLLREARAVAHAEWRIRKARKKPFSNKYEIKLIRQGARAKLTLNKEAVEQLFHGMDNIELLAKQNASLIIGVMANVNRLKKDIKKAAANDPQYEKNDSHKKAA